MLTGRKRRCLHDDILEYLKAAGFAETAAVFDAEKEQPVADQIEVCALERKYASILRTAKLLSQAEESNKELTRRLDEMQDPTKVKQALATRDYMPSRVIYTLEGHAMKREICSLVFHPTQSLFFSGGEDGKIKIWDYETGESMGTLLGHEGAVKCLAIDTTGLRLASCSEDTDIRVYDLATESLFRRMSGHEHTVSFVEFVQPDCRLIVSASRDGTVRLWDVQNNCVDQVFRSANEMWVRACHVLPNNKLVRAGDDHCVTVWDTNTRVERIVGGHDHAIEVLAVANANACEVLRILERSLQNKRDGDGDDEGDSGELATYVASGSRDKLIKIWNMTNSTEVVTIQGHKDWVRGLVFHLNGRSLFSCSDDGTVKVHSLEDLRCIKTIKVQEASFVSSIGYHPAGRFLTTGSSDNQIKVYKCE